MWANKSDLWVCDTARLLLTDPFVLLFSLFDIAICTFCTLITVFIALQLYCKRLLHLNVRVILINLAIATALYSTVKAAANCFMIVRHLVPIFHETLKYPS